MRVIEPKLWNSQKWRRSMTDIELRYFWLYLLTCPFSKSCGIFYLPIDTMIMETKISQEKVEKHLKELISLKMIDYNYDTEEIIIYNFPKYNIIRLGKPMEDCLKSELSSVKEIKLIKNMIGYLESYIKTKVNDKKINILTNILNIYKESISISITINNESSNESCDEEEIDWDELMKQMEDDD